MELVRKIFAATLLSGVVTMANLGAAQAGDFSPAWKTMKPLYAVSFDVGRKHVLSYFLTKNSLCDLTVLVTNKSGEAPVGNEIPPLETVRFVAEITSGKSAGFDTAEGKTLEYACASGAQAMTVREIKQIAETAPHR